jgi:hypothetical protein
MGECSAVWESFWDLASPQEAVQFLRELYGQNATKFSAECALAAIGDGRTEDYGFWLAVFADLLAADAKPVVTAAATEKGQS